MFFVSVTRLHLGTLWSFPPFLYYALSSSRQARRSPGFIEGWVSNDAERGAWTATVWDSLESMQAFRNHGMHRKAMPKLLRWCDEAAYVHWEQDSPVAPDQETAYRRLSHEGKLSKLNAPSARQRSGSAVGVARPRRLQRLKPHH